MNNPHKNARTTPPGGAEMMRRIAEERRPLAEVAVGSGMSDGRREVPGMDIGLSEAELLRQPHSIPNI
jgi:hypothetical protein